MSTETKPDKKQKLLAELYLALDDLTYALAVENNETVRQSEVFQAALKVVRILKEMRKANIAGEEIRESQS